MKGFLICWDGAELELPELVEYRLEYTAGTPCDSFAIKCLWEPGLERRLSDGIGFAARENGEVVFRGVVDEFECRWEDTGSLLEISGRGMAALLLDNEAEAVDYGTATAEDILRDHVTPYGVEIAERGNLPAVTGFSVASGSSEWQVLYQFARYYGGVAPRFDRRGGLVLTPWRGEETKVLDDTAPVTALIYREKRYGVLSEILVRDKTRQAVERVENTEFAKKGGRCRRVMSTPGRSNYLAMRYSGQFQLDRAQAQWIRVELVLPKPFAAWPGELLALKRTGLGCNGTYRVLEAAVEVDGNGGRTRLVLGEPNAVI